MNETINYEYPKDVVDYIGKRISSGNDFIVFELGDEWVAKRPNFERASPRKKFELSTPEYFTTLIEDNRKLKAIFGDNFAETLFYPSNNSRNYVLVQKRFKPEQFLNNVIEENDPSAFIASHREEFKNLVFGAKRALLEFGFPVDIQPSNLVWDGNKLLFMEADCPTYRAEKNRTSGGYSDKARKELERLNFYEQELNLSPEEKNLLNSKFGIDETLLAQKIREITVGSEE